MLFSADSRWVLRDTDKPHEPPATHTATTHHHQRTLPPQLPATLTTTAHHRPHSPMPRTSAHRRNHHKPLVALKFTTGNFSTLSLEERCGSTGLSFRLTWVIQDLRRHLCKIDVNRAWFPSTAYHNYCCPSHTSHHNCQAKWLLWPALLISHIVLDGDPPFQCFEMQRQSVKPNYRGTAVRPQEQ